MKKSAWLMLGIGALLLGGCTTCAVAPSSASTFLPASGTVAELPVQSGVTRLSAVGYGAASSYDGYSVGQKRLLAMRASKLDAYRALAEQVHGVRITGHSTVAALMAQNDSFRVYVDAYIRGARVMTVTPMADGNYETVIELDFDEQLIRNHLTQAPLRAVPVTLVAPVAGVRGIVGPGAAYGASFYYAE